MKTLKEIKELLAQYKQELKEKFKVKEIGIFGSAIRGDRRQTSDIDLLVDFKDEADLNVPPMAGLSDKTKESDSPAKGVTYSTYNLARMLGKFH